MAETSYPFEDTDVSESQFAAWAAAMGASGVVTGLAVAPVSGMQVGVAAGAALVRGLYYGNDATKSLTIGAAPAAGNTRKDYVVLHLNMATNTIVAEVKAGTANTSGGALPSLTQTATEWEHPLAVVTVASGTAAITAGMIQGLLVDHGQRVRQWADAGSKPGMDQMGTAAALGLQVSDMTLWRWNGSTWSQFANTVTWANVSGKPSTFPPTTPVNAATLNGKVWNHGASLPASGTTVGDLFFIV